MNFRLALFLFLLLFAGKGLAFSEEAVFVTVMPAEPAAVVKGQAAELAVRVKIKKGFHIQANPAADEFLIPTTLAVKANKDIVPGEPVYPPGTPYRLQDSKEDLLTYEDEAVIKLPVKALDSAAAGNADLAGELKFQPCDDRRCFFPRSIPVLIPVKIVETPK